MRRLATTSRIAIAAFAIALAGCTSTDSTAPSVSVPGIYTMRTVNGGSLPYPVTATLSLNSDVLTLFNDGTFSNSAQTSDGAVSVLQGTYTSINGSITFVSSTDGTTFAGSLSGSVLTVIVGTLTETFSRN